jgi:hypothetical protein
MEYNAVNTTHGKFYFSFRAFHNDGYRHAKNFIVEKLDISGKEIGVSVLDLPL